MGAKASAQRIEDRSMNQQQKQDYSLRIPSQSINYIEQQQSQQDEYLNQFYLKNQPFQKQKQYAIRALLLLLIKMVLLLMVFGVQTTLFFNLNIHPYLNYKIFVFFYLILIIVSRFPIFQNTPISYAIFILSILLEPFILFYSYLHFTKLDILINFYFLVMRFICGYFSIISLILYLCFECYAFQMKRVLIFNVIAAFVFILCVFVYINGDIDLMIIFILILSFIMMTASGLLIALVTKQMFEGRFSVRINQIFGMANAYSFGLLFPCNF